MADPVSIDAEVTPLLAGACSRLARICHFNAWAVRAIFVLLLLAKTLVAIVAYGLLALAFQLADRYRNTGPDEAGEKPSGGPSQSPYHDRHLADLDRRFREWEDSLITRRQS